MNIYRPLQVGWVQQCRAVKLLMRVNVNECHYVMKRPVTVDLTVTP